MRLIVIMTVKEQIISLSINLPSQSKTFKMIDLISTHNYNINQFFILIMSQSRPENLSQQAEPQESNWFQNGLIKIVFRDTTILSANALTILAVPQPLHQQMMSAIRFVHCYTQFHKVHSNQQYQLMKRNQYVPPVKLGEPFYLEFYFLNKYLYYNDKEEKFMLSESQKTVFKIMTQAKINSYDSKTVKREQTFQNIGKIRFEDCGYHIIMAEQTICLKSNGNSIYPGNYDERAQLSIIPSLFSINSSSIYHTPCRLYSLQEEKYVFFDFKNSQMKLGSSKTFIQGLCRLEKQQGGVLVRVMQLNNDYYLSSKQQAYLNEEIVRDLSKMLKNISVRQFSMDSFVYKRELSISTQKLSFGQISGIALPPFPQGYLQEEAREDFVANISIKHLSKQRMQRRGEKQFLFKIQTYRNGEEKRNIFLSKQSQKIIKNIKEQTIGQICIQYSLDIALPSQTFILREANRSNFLLQKNKFKSLFRVQPVNKQHFAPFTSFYGLYLNISLFNHYKKIGRVQLNLVEIQCILQEMLATFYRLQEHEVNQLEFILLQLAELEFLTILFETIKAVMHKIQPAVSEGSDKWIQKINRGEEESLNLIIKIIVLLVKLISFKVVMILLQQKVFDLLEKLCKIDMIYKELIKVNRITAEQPQTLIKLIESKIENTNPQTSPRAYKLCSFWGILILKQYKMKSQIIENTSFSVSKTKQQITDYDALLMLQIKQLINSHRSFVKQIMPSLSLQQLKNEEIQIQVRQKYLEIILNGHRSQIRLPLVLVEGSQLDHISRRYKLKKQNKAVLSTYLEEILPQRSQVELVENKIISFGLVQLYLQLYQDVYELQAETEHNKIKTLAILINHLENNISVYRYQLEMQSKYLLNALKTLLATYTHYLKQLFYNQLSKSPHSTHKALLQKCRSDWQLFIQSKSIEAKQIFTSINDSFDDALVSKESRRQRIKNEIHTIKHKIFGKIFRITDLLFQKTGMLLGKGIDREYIWAIIDGKYDYISLNQRVSILDKTIELVSLQNNPQTLIRQQFNSLYNTQQEVFTDQFMQILLMMVDKTYPHEFWRYTELLNNCLTQNYQWKVFICLFNKNRMLSSFLDVAENQERQPQKINSLFTFLLNLQKKYLQFHSIQQQKEVSTKLIQGQYYYLQFKDIQIKHECQPQNFIKHLKKLTPNYQKSQIQLHYHLICSLGVIINQQSYEFYQQYIIRFQCQNYSKEFIQLVLAFFQSLPKTYKQTLANALSYSYFKQHLQIKNLMLKFSELNQAALHLGHGKHFSTNKKSDNFKFLIALDNQEETMRKRSWTDDGSDLLSLLFQLFSEITINSNNTKDFASKIGYSLFYSIIEPLKDNLQLKACLSRFLYCHVRKSFLYMKENYMQQQKNNKRMLQENEEWKQLIEWIKETNSFLYNEIQFFKKLNCSQDSLKCYINYIVILIEKIQLREEITDHFMPNRSEKIKSEVDPLRNQQQSFKFGLENRDMHEMIFQDKDSHNYIKSESNQNDFSNISQINQMLGYEMIQKLEQVLTDEETTAKIGDLLFWLENKYGINLNSMNHSFFQNKTTTTFLLNLNHQHELKDSARLDIQAEVNEEHFERINDFLRPRIENYLVLLIELLQRTIVVYYSASSNGNGEQQDKTSSKLINILNLIEICLQDQIIIYQQLDKANEKRLYQALPFKFTQISDFQKRRLQQKTQGTQNQKCCKLDYTHIQVLFNLLIKCFNNKDNQFVSHLHLILQKSVLYNIQNQINLQKIIQKHYSTYFQIVYSIIKHFKCTSPLVSHQNFVFHDLFSPQKFHLYGNSLMLCPPSRRNLHLKRYEDKISETRGIISYRNELKYFRNTMNMFIAVSKYLNFNFKQLLSQSTIDKQSLLYQLLDLLQETVLYNLSVITLDKLQLIECVIKLIISFLRGPIQPNIHICIDKHYYSKVLKHLLKLTYELKQNQNQQVKICLLRIRKTVAQTMFIINPYMPQGQIQIQLIEEGFKNAYYHSRKLYNGNYEDIIIDQNNPQKRLEESLLFFDLALHFFYCLIELYQITGNNTIKKAQIALLKKQEEKKKYQMRWMTFYQIYMLFGDIISAIKKRLSNTQQVQNLQKDDVLLLKKAIQFFSQHVGNIDVKIQGKIKTISFLLLKQTKCRTHSIRNELHRWVGTDQRALKLNNFLAVSKFIILRLQIEASVTKVIQNIKPLEIIVKNRQLWKSISFWFIVVLNLLYVFTRFFNQYLQTDQQALLAIILLVALYIFQIFLIIVYIVQIIPLRVKMYRLINADGFKIRSILTFLNAKTLYFILFYLIFISLSLWDLVWISVLSIDYFFRFKRSDFITNLLYRCLFRIFLVILIFAFIIFAAAMIEMATGFTIHNCDSPAACTQQNFAFFLDLSFNYLRQIKKVTEGDIVGIFFSFFLKILLKGLLVGLIFAEQKSQNDRLEQISKKIKHSCFICGFSQNEIQKVMKVKDGFYMHLRMEHNLWNYVYYLIYLKNRDKKDLNSIQSLIVQKWNNNEIDWLPDQLSK